MANNNVLVGAKRKGVKIRVVRVVIKQNPRFIKDAWRFTGNGLRRADEKLPAKKRGQEKFRQKHAMSCFHGVDANIQKANDPTLRDKIVLSTAGFNQTASAPPIHSADWR